MAQGDLHGVVGRIAHGHEIGVGAEGGAIRTAGGGKHRPIRAHVGIAGVFAIGPAGRATRRDLALLAEA